MGIGALWIKTPRDHPVLQMKLTTFNNYYNRHRTHSALNGTTPIETPETKGVDFKSYGWQAHCRMYANSPSTHSGIERKSPRRMRAIVPATPPRAARHQQASRQRGDNAGARQDIRIADGHEDPIHEYEQLQQCDSGLLRRFSPRPRKSFRKEAVRDGRGLKTKGSSVLVV